MKVEKGDILYITILYYNQVNYEGIKISSIEYLFKEAKWKAFNYIIQKTSEYYDDFPEMKNVYPKINYDDEKSIQIKDKVFEYSVNGGFDCASIIKKEIDKSINLKYLLCRFYKNKFFEIIDFFENSESYKIFFEKDFINYEKELDISNIICSYVNKKDKDEIYLIISI
jgi:hypothetical protein